MPVQTPQWTEFLNCPVCTSDYNEDPNPPVSLGCGHTICKSCLSNFPRPLCPFDQTEISTPLSDLPINHGLLQLLIGNYEQPKIVCVEIKDVVENQECFDYARICIEDLAKYLLPFSNLSIGFNKGATNGVGNGINNSVTNGGLTRPMQRKLVTLLHCQLVEEEGRFRAVRAARSLGERAVKELILLHQNSQHLSASLWNAVRSRGCQFLGPAMQEDVLKLILLALEDGNALSRTVLVLFVVNKLETKFTQASKTSIGHVVQLLYRASCFKITKRNGDSSLLELSEKFRTYSALRKEHDAQIVQIALEAGLHISPEQWSALLYGDEEHRSHMQSIIDKLQTPGSFVLSIQELFVALQRTKDPAKLQRHRQDLERLAQIDPNPEGEPPTWDELMNVMMSLRHVINGLVDFVQNHSKKLRVTMEAQQAQKIKNSKYKTSMCRDILKRASCPRGSQCSFAHSLEELEKHRKKNIALQSLPNHGGLTQNGSYSPPEGACTPNGLENSMNGSRDSPDELTMNGSNGAQIINAEPVQNGYANGNFQAPAVRNFQRPPANTNAQINPISVTYLTSQMQQMQQSRRLYLDGSQPGYGACYVPNVPSHAPFVSPGIMYNPNDAHFVPMQPNQQQFTPQYIPAPQCFHYYNAARRGADDKDILNGNVESKAVMPSMMDDLKLDTAVGSSSLFSEKNESMWRESGVTKRGSSIGSGLDTSSDYSSETFSPLSNESCGSPKLSTIKNYGNSWNQFDSCHQRSKESSDSSKHSFVSRGIGSSFSQLNSLPNSSIWSQSHDDDIFSAKSPKPRSHPKTEWTSRGIPMYEDWPASKKDEEDRVAMRFNYSADIQSSFEEASSDDLCAGRFQEWSITGSKVISPPPGLQQQAPIGTPIAPKSTGNYNGKMFDHMEFPRSRNRCNFPSMPSGGNNTLN